MRHFFRCVLFVLTAALSFSGCSSSGTENLSMVKKVDHVTINSTDPAALFHTFTKTLGLPLAWPLSSYPGFTTGGVFLGNMNIEMLQFAGTGQVGENSLDRTFIYGIVLEPYSLSEVMDELRLRGAGPSEPRDQMREVDGEQVKVWTNVILNGLSTDNYIVYLCEYTQKMQETMAQRVRDNPVPLGGIGVTGVQEVIVTSKRVVHARNLWGRVFDPAVMSMDGKLHFDYGPAVFLSEGTMDVIEGLVVEVASLQTAKQFLLQNGLLGESSATEISIDPRKVQNLNIKLVERQRWLE